MTELKRCPFCGSEADLYQNYNRRYRMFFVTVKCEMCGAQGKSFSSKIAPSDEGWETVACESAEKAWNTRTERSNDE